MVGQKDILNNVDYWIKTDTVPRFMIISGITGSGRTTLAREIAKKMRAYLVECELSVDAVREAVQNCYKCAGTTVYLFKDADKMSTAAKNAMLKITEEPPRQAHFIVTVQNPENMLETLRSRATNIAMAPYSAEELDSFYSSSVLKKNSRIREICDTPGLMLQMEKIEIDELLQFCETVVDNIQQVTGVNAFKIVQRIKLKEGAEGHDLEMFFHCLKYVLLLKMRENRNDIQSQQRLARMLGVTSRYYQELNITGVKKDSTLDMWVLEMREA